MASIPPLYSPCSNQDTLDKLNGLSYMPCTAKLDLLDALAEAGANPVKSCLQVTFPTRHKAAFALAGNVCVEYCSFLTQERLAYIVKRDKRLRATCT